ncbi:MAG: UDP-N-acetylglucosamine 4,6-dehydratase (inverting) [Firmicutes bacterium HGW-Firmicutes-7]|nr:MAG: UDP-N-acetylglucosamine 4,6-dehydratase (inverting) [Firmicutes bacterium HGW-Firmicutes-7]
MIIAIIQARMNSSRLPGKVMMEFCGIPNIYHVYNRVKASKKVDEVIIATSSNSADDRIAEYCHDKNIVCYRGSEDDVLDRYYKSIDQYKLSDGDGIVRITADCPLIDSDVIDEVVKVFLENQYDFVSNIQPPTFPDGLDVEVMSYRLLEEMWRNAQKPLEREHITQYLYNNIHKYAVANIENEIDISSYRWTLDEVEDYSFIKEVYESLFPINPAFGKNDVLKYLESNQDLIKINQIYKRNVGLEKSIEIDRQHVEKDNYSILDEKTILITGGTGSFGKKFIEIAFKKFNPRKVIVYSRDEFKQFNMQKEFKNKLSEEDFNKLRFFIGDVRDLERLQRAFVGVDYVIHAAAMKQVPACEYNPFEAVKTNIHGAQNVVTAALDRGVKKVVALSTDKAVNPINLYGGTKLVSDKLFISANAYAGDKDITFSVVRYGNVAGSRGSVIPFFKDIISRGELILPITDFRMTRFWITLEQGVDLVLKALRESKGGETYISKIPSFKITDLAKAICENIELKEIGIREGEKLHEVMITRDDSRLTYEYDEHYIIYPSHEWWDYKSRFTEGGEPIAEGFEYSSSDNIKWLNTKELKKEIKKLEIH